MITGGWLCENQRIIAHDLLFIFSANTENGLFSVCFAFGASSFSFCACCLRYSCRLSSFCFCLSLSFYSFLFFSSSFLIISKDVALRAGPGWDKLLFLDEEMSYFFLCSFLRFLCCFLFFVSSNAVICLCAFVVSLYRFVASAWFYSTCIGLTCVKLLVLFMSIRKWYVVLTFYLSIFFSFSHCGQQGDHLSSWHIRLVCHTHARWSTMFWLTAVAAYSMSTTFIFVVTEQLTIVTQKGVWYIDIYFHLYKAYL